MLREALGKVLPHAVRSRIKDLLRMPQVERSVALKGEVQFWRNWLSTNGMYWPEDFRARFAMDEFVRHCLLNGLDDIVLTLQHEKDIAAYEAQHPAPPALAIGAQTTR